EAAARTTFHKAKRLWEHTKQRARRRWIATKTRELTSAHASGDLGRVYTILRRISLLESGTSFKGWERFTLEQMRQHVMEIAKDLGHVEDATLQHGLPALEPALWIDDVPEHQEIIKALKGMRETAAGPDQLTPVMLKNAGPALHALLVAVVQAMWQQDPDTWPASVHEGYGIFLHKKGPREKLDNYRCIMICSICSRLIARIVSARLTRYLDKAGLLPEQQYGFRPYRSVAGLIFFLRIVLECAAAPDTMDVGDPLTINEAMFTLTERAGIPPTARCILRGLHSLTSYQIKSSEGLSEPSRLPRGLREGDVTSCPLFNLYHANAMRHATAATRAEFGEDVGVPLEVRNSVRLGLKPGAKARQAPTDELFTLPTLHCADDTNLFCRRSQHKRLERLLEDTLKLWGVEVHPGKYERLITIPEGDPHPPGFAEAARFIGGWLRGDGRHSTDTTKRAEQANELWQRLFSQIPRLAIDPKDKGRLIRAFPMAGMLPAAEARLWSAGDIKRLQVIQNRMVRGALAQRIRDMHEQQLTMSDLRLTLGLDLVSTEMGWRQLAWLGHVARMPEDRLERRALSLWIAGHLPREGRVASSTRRQLWQRLCELLVFTDLQRKDYQTAWMSLAQENNGKRWRFLMRE
ncbi:unnamed protein product, partial [Prorocentrum cordatum]